MAGADFIFRLFSAIFLTAIALFIIIGNSVNLVVLQKVKNIKEVTKTFMISLAFADLGIGCVLSVMGIAAASAGYWPFSHAACGFYGVSLVFLEPASLLTLVIISAEIYIAVMMPFQYPILFTLTRARVIVVIAWFSVLLFALLYGPLLNRVAVYSSTFQMCFYVPADPTQLDVLGISSVCIFVICPIFLIVSIYVRIYFVARRHARQIADSGQIHTQGQSASESKRTITFLVITAGFCVAWTPFASTVLYAYFTRERPSPYLGLFSQVMFLSNSWLNVIVYYWKNKAFREELRKLVGPLFGRANVVNGGDSGAGTSTA